MRLKCVLLLCWALALLTGCQAAKTTARKTALPSNEIVVMVQGAHTGDLAEYGLPTVDAVQVVARQYNDNGGLLGKRIVVETFDDACQTNRADDAIRAVRKSGAKLVIGPTCSTTSIAMRPLYKQERVIAISPSTTALALRNDQGFPWFFRSLARDLYEVDMAMLYLERHNVEEVVLLSDNDKYNRADLDEFYVRARSSGKIRVAASWSTDSSPRIREFLQQALGRKVPYVVYFGSLPGSLTVMNVMAEVDEQQRPTLLLGSFATGEKAVDSGVELQDWVRYLETIPQTKALAERATDYYQRTGKQAIFYDTATTAAEVLFKAVERAKTLDADAVAEVLRTTRFETTNGQIRFDEQGAIPAQDAFVIKMIRNGRPVVVLDERLR